MILTSCELVLVVAHVTDTTRIAPFLGEAYWSAAANQSSKADRETIFTTCLGYTDSAIYLLNPVGVCKNDFNKYNNTRITYQKK